MRHQLLHLMHHVVIDYLSLEVNELLGNTIFHRERVVAEGWDHEELLHHHVHTADAAQVLQASLLLSAFHGIAGRCVIPPIMSLDQSHEWEYALFQENIHKKRALLNQVVKEAVGGILGLLAKEGRY